MQRYGRRDVIQVGDRLVPGSDPFVIADEPAVTECPHPGQIRGDLHSGDRSPPGTPKSRWSPSGCSDHPAAGSMTANRSPARPGGSASIAPLSAAIRSVGAHPSARLGASVHHPRLQRGVELRGRGKLTARKERAFQIVVCSFDQALGLRIRRPADDHFRGQRAPERLAIGGQLP